MRKLVLLMLAMLLPAFAADSWRETLQQKLPLYGHRNWIVVADSAYPQQSNEGIETIVSGADQIDVLKEVFAALAAAKHVRPIIYTDRELQFLPEADAPGVTEYRRQLATMIGDQPVNVLPHEKIIKQLGEVSQSFRVLIIKTNMRVPYTSVFLQLDCAYWNADAEARLRATLAANSAH
jgi:hypothetical protein